jgi:sugar phosphate isomerase/epimerase
MKLIVFSKMLQEKSVAELIELAQRHGYDGYDLAVRPGHPVNPDNAATALPQAQAQMEQAGLQIGMVTGNFDLLTADHPLAEPLLAAMDSANVRLLKLGYFRFEPQTMDYWEQVENVRRAFAAWEKLASIYNVKICYHTHSHYCMGLNAAALMHLLRDFDPAYLGAYLDPGHFAVDGEPFDFGLAMAREHLSILSVKDVLVERVEKNGHGAAKALWVAAGEGIVDWTAVFTELRRIEYDGFLSIHCEYDIEDEEDWFDTFVREVAFFRKMRGNGEE